MFRSFFVLALVCIGVCEAQQQPPRPRPPQPQPPRQPGQPPRQPGQPQPPRQPGQPTQPQPPQTGPTQRRPPGAGEIPQCIQEIRQLEVTCFANAGFQLQIADAIILNQTARLPANTQVVDLKRGLCNKRAELIQCIVPPVLNKRGQPPCTNQAEFNFVETEMVRRMTALQQTCGAGSFSGQQKPCMRDLDRNMRECYQKVGVKQSMFMNNMTQIRGAIIGVDKKSAQQFCGLREKLFECQRQIIRSCDGAEDFMLVTGYDHDAMEESIELLCGDTDVYLNGLQCFQTPTQLGIQCMKQMSSRLLDLAAKKIKDSLNITRYYDEYCQIRIEHLGCDIEAWKTKCTDASVGLKNEYECTMLPTKCKKHSKLQNKLKTQICAEPAFFKSLRSDGGGLFSMTFGVLISIALGVLLTVI